MQIHGDFVLLFENNKNIFAVCVKRLNQKNKCKNVHFYNPIRIGVTVHIDILKCICSDQNLCVTNRYLLTTIQHNVIMINCNIHRYLSINKNMLTIAFV